MLLSVPRSIRYTDLMCRFSQKTGQVVAAEFQKPGDELMPDELIPIRDDSDVEEMFEEYFFSIEKALRTGGENYQRLRVFLGPPSVHLNEEEQADCNRFLEDIEANEQRDASLRNNSLGSKKSNDSCLWVERGRHLGGSRDFPRLTFPNKDVDVEIWPGFKRETFDIAAFIFRTQNSSHNGGIMLPDVPGQCTSHSQTLEVFGDKYQERHVEAKKSLKRSIVNLPSTISCWGRKSCQESLQDFSAQWMHLSGSVYEGSMRSLDMKGSCVPSSPMLDRASSESSSICPPGYTVALSEVEVIKKIGEGAFGEVSLAMCKTFGKVAIKWLKPEKQEKNGADFWAEANTLRNLNHPNVLRFYGAVMDSFEEGKVRGIITEYMKGGSLSAFLRAYPFRLSLLQRAELALGAVKGLAYLHDLNIVHFDLKPENLLLEHTTMNPQYGWDGQQLEWEMPALKVADFGLSKQQTSAYVSGMTEWRGTLPYMAPEVLIDPRHVDAMSDVWSMGMCMFEMFTGQPPFADLTPNDIITNHVAGSLQPQVPDDCEPDWRNLMELCWNRVPSCRPTFRQLAAMLEEILDTAR